MGISELNTDQFKWQNLVVRYRKNTVDKNVIDHSFDNDIFYARIKEFRAEAKMNIIDIGAHIGTFSILTAIKYPDSHVYSLEPFPETYQLLNENIIDNKLGQIMPLEYAVTDRDKQIKLYLSKDNWEHSTTNSESLESIIVDGIRLDSFVSKFNLQKIDLIKFNCEGAEFDILKSISKATFEKIRMMVILFHEDMVLEYTRDVIYDILTKNNFIYREINRSKNRGWIIAKNPNYYSRITNFYLVKWNNLVLAPSKVYEFLIRNLQWLIKKL